MRTESSDKTDVIIIGGGPAGLTTSIRLKQKIHLYVWFCWERLLSLVGILHLVVMEPRAINELSQMILMSGIALPENLVRKSQT